MDLIITLANMKFLIEKKFRQIHDTITIQSTKKGVNPFELPLSIQSEAGRGRTPDSLNAIQALALFILSCFAIFGYICS